MIGKYAIGGRAIGAGPVAASGGVDNLTASGIATAAPLVAAPTIGQIHALTASGITTGVPDVSAPSLDPLHGFTQDALDFLVAYVTAHSPRTHLNAITGEVEYLLPIGD